MGFYDCRCLATGVSLKGADTVAVLLRRAGRGYRPISLGIAGNYDRLGKVDHVRETAHTGRVLAYFLDREAAGELAVEAKCLGERHPFQDIDDVLNGCERNMNDGGGVVTLAGRDVTFALVSHAVWRAVAANPPDDPTRDLFDRVFGDDPAAAAIVGPDLGAVREVAAVADFLAANGRAWGPSKADGQHYPDDMTALLAGARAAFVNSPAALRGLDAYEREVADLLVDNED